jgi:hypothetical protein
MAVFFVFLCWPRSESLTLPLAIILIVPMCLCDAGDQSAADGQQHPGRSVWWC